MGVAKRKEKVNKENFFILLIFSVLALILFVLVPRSIKIGENKDFTEQKEICYKGVKYVKFNEGKRSWGSVVFNKEGKVELCEK